METPSGPVKDEEYPPLPSMGASLDAETHDTLAAKRFEVHLVASIAGEVGRGSASGIDAVLEVGAFFCYCADFFLEDRLAVGLFSSFLRESKARKITFENMFFFCSSCSSGIDCSR